MSGDGREEGWSEECVRERGRERAVAGRTVACRVGTGCGGGGEEMTGADWLAELCPFVCFRPAGVSSSAERRRPCEFPRHFIGGHRCAPTRDRPAVNGPAPPADGRCGWRKWHRTRAISLHRSGRMTFIGAEFHHRARFFCQGSRSGVVLMVFRYFASHS